MPDKLEQQLKQIVELVNTELPPVTVDEVSSMTAAPFELPAKKSWTPTPAIALAAATAVLLAIGGIALLIDLSNDTEPIEPVSTTVPEAVPSTTAPVSTTLASSAEGSGIIWVDVEWTRVRDDSGVFDGAGVTSIEAVTLGGPGLVAVGTECERYCAPFLGPPPDLVDNQDAAIWVTTDGADWMRIPHDEAVFGGPGRQVITDVVAAGPGLVAVGIVDHSYVDWIRWPELRPEPVGGRDDLDAAIWTSPDGVTWQLVADPDAVFSGTGDGSSPVAGDQAMEAVAIGEGRIVAVGSAHEDAAVWVSTDGTSWQRIPHDDEVFGGPSAQWMHDVTYTGDRFVAVGSELDGGDDNMIGAVWTSEDGLAWAKIANGAEVFGPDPATDNHMYITAVTGTPDGLVAAGIAACVPFRDFRCDADPADMPMPLWSSRDGLEWERIEDDTAPFAYPATSTKRTPNNTLLRHAPVRALIAFEGGLVSVGWDRGFATVPLTDTELSFEHGFAPGQLFTSVAMTDVVAVGDRFIAVGHSSGNGAIWIGSITR